MSEENSGLSVEDAVKALMPSDNEGSPNEEVTKEDTSSDETSQNETTQVETQENDSVDEVNHTDGDEDSSDEQSDYSDTLVELDDGSQIKLDDLIELHKKDKSLQADYTRKTQSLAEQRKAVERQHEEYQTSLSQFNDKVAQLDTLMAAIQGEEKSQEIDFTLAEDNPAEFVRQMALREANQKKLADAKEKVEEARKVLLAEQEKQQREFIDKQVELMYEAIPEWRDDKVRVAKQTDLLQKAKDKYGFTDQELQIADHRHWLLLQDALLGAEVSQKKPAIEKKVKKAPKILKAQGSKTKSQIKQENVQTRMKNLSKSKGNIAVRDAASLLRDMGIV